MPEINTNNMTPEQLNDHINGHHGGKGPATYCGHTTPYGPCLLYTSWICTRPGWQSKVNGAVR